MDLIYRIYLFSANLDVIYTLLRVRLMGDMDLIGTFSALDGF